MNFSSFDFASKLGTKTKVTQFTNVKSRILQYVNEINSLARTIQEEMRSLLTQEEYQRAQIIKELRGMKKWRQIDLGAEVRVLFPRAAASQSTISRIENRQKLVTPQIAEEFSQVFKVDSGLFMPHFFYE